MGRALRCIHAFKSNNNSGNNGSSVNIRSIVGEAELKCILEDSVIDVVSTVDSAVLTGDIFYTLGIILYQLFARGGNRYNRHYRTKATHQPIQTRKSSSQ